jgi:pyruvate dehydrogenase complex dehydrogenase (E1) component
VQKLDALFAIERDINGKNPAERLAARKELSAPLMEELQAWLNAQLAKVSRNHDVAKAINYMLRRWNAFTRLLTMAGSASRTTPPNGRCAVCPLAASRGSSAARIAAASAPPSPTR